MRLLRRIRRVARSLIFYSLIMFLAILFTGALVIYIIEHGHNPGIRNYFDAVWFVMETITTVGYGDIVPATFWGRVADMVIMPLGIAVVSLLTASIATELTSASIMRNLGRHTSSRGGHIVVIGGVSKALNVITEIINNMERRNRFWDITYLYDGERPSSLPSDVEFVRGNPFNRDDLIRAGVDKASIVIILPFDEQDPVTSDAKVALLVMSVRGLNRDSYIIAEVLNQGNVGYVLNAGANSVVSLGSFTTTVIAKEIFDRGTSSALMNLIRRIDIMDSKDFIGLRFGDALERLRISGRGILIGVVRGGDVLINPGNNYTIQSGDSLLVVS